MKIRQALTAACLLILCPMLACAGEPEEAKDPLLLQLSDKLKAILEENKLPPLANLEPEKRAALLDGEYGYSADYKHWIADVRSYNRKLQEFHGYRNLPIIDQLTDDPIQIPWRMEAWVRHLVAGPPGIETAFRQVDLLLSSLPGVAGVEAAPAQVAQAPPSPTPGTPFDQFVSAFIAAGKIMDKEALGSIPPKERELLRLVIPWICQTQQTFYFKSKGSPDYSLNWYLTSNEELDTVPGKVSPLKAPLLAEFHGLTGLGEYLKALASEPLQRDHPLPPGVDQHLQFKGHVDFAAMRRAWNTLTPALSPTALDKLRDYFAKEKAVPSTVRGVTGTIYRVVDTPYGKIIVGGPGNNRYEDPDAAVILDLGGDDEYVYNHPEDSIGKQPIQIIVDFAGDDVYQTKGVGGPGAGLLGISILIDRAGNDRYCQGLSPHFQPRANNRATLLQVDPESPTTHLVPFTLLWGNPRKPEEPGVMLDAGFAFGAGFLGVGCLIDEAGDDLYLGQKYAFGCAMWRGIGLLHDVSGNDVYAAGLASIGAGINGAFGVLDDRGGDDHYQCLGMIESDYSVGQKWDNGYEGCGIGYGSSWRTEMRGKNRNRPTLGGGFGLVHDAAGNDCYVTSSFGLASGYAGGVGVVVDDAGNDTYFVKRGPGGDSYSGWSGNHALGNGCHRGVGYLLDRAGNDTYCAAGGGTAWDRSMGYLLDLGGDDSMIDLYGKNFMGNTGWGAAMGFAVSFQVGGKDAYQRGSFGDATAIAQGYPGKGGNFSFFFDVGPEEDAYPQKDQNNTIHLGGVHWSREKDGKEYPDGLGLFLDGPDVLKLQHD